MPSAPGGPAPHSWSMEMEEEEAPTCIKCERSITRRRPQGPGHAGGSAGGSGKGGGGAASLWQQSQAPGRTRGDDDDEEEGDDLPHMAALPPVAASFVMVARMADMSMSFLHVQEAAAAAMAASATTAAQQHQAPRGPLAGGGARRGESGHGPGGRVAGLSEHLKRAEMVLKYGSGQAPLDCPACVHCLDAMQQALDRGLGELQREEAAYAAVIKGDGPLSVSASTAAEPAAALAELAAARAAQEEALRALEEQFELSEAEAVGLERELQEVARQERAQEAEERGFWRRLAGYELGAAAADEECADLLRDIARLHARAESLAPSSASPSLPSPAANPALASLLPLSLEGAGAGAGDGKRKDEDGGGSGGGGSRPLSVNGFRLARREAPRRDLWWPEINAAWGQVVLLLNAVAHQVGFQSPRYKAVYLGASSRILQDPGLRSQLAFPLFVARRAAPRVDEGARRVCLLGAELQRHVLALDGEERRMELHVGERLMDLDLSPGGLRDEATWAAALARLVGSLRWLVRVAGAAMPLLEQAEGAEAAGGEEEEAGQGS